MPEGEERRAAVPSPVNVPSSTASPSAVTFECDGLSGAASARGHANGSDGGGGGGEGLSRSAPNSSRGAGDAGDTASRSAPGSRVPSPPSKGSANSPKGLSPRAARHGKMQRSPQPATAWPPSEPSFPPSGYKDGILHVLPPLGAAQSHTVAASMLGAAVGAGGLPQTENGDITDSWFPKKKKEEATGAWTKV